LAFLINGAWLSNTIGIIFSNNGGFFVMDFTKYKLEKTDQGYILHLYLDPGLEEFAKELGTTSSEKQKDLRRMVTQFVNKKFPGVHISVAKVIIGSTLISIIPVQMNVADAQEGKFSMSYLYSGTTPTFIKEVKNTKGNLDVVAPSYFEMNSDGSLKLTYQFDPTFIQAMHDQNVKVVPFLGNNWNRTLGRAALANRDALSTQIADAIEKYNLDGVNIDIENVNEQDRDNYTDFIKLLSEKIPADKEVSVAVAPNPYHWKSGWQASYDNSKLAQYADYLMLMAYDESYNGSPEGPVAEFPWVEKSIQSLINDDGVPSSKIVLGLPFYGRYWNRSESIGGYGIPDYQVASLVAKYHGTTSYDPSAQTAKATFTINPGDATTVVAGRTLTPGTYDVFYENNDSIRAKMSLVAKYNLKGTGSWAFGQEDPSVWDNYGVWLAGNTAIPVDTAMPFVDARGHWARDEILYAYQKDWFHGVSATQFAPEKGLTRAEAATLFVNVLGLKATEPVGNTFPDVSNDSWAKESIEIAALHGIFNGYSDGKFHPNDILTREQMATVFDNIFHGVYDPTKADIPVNYEDVSPTHWSYNVIVAMNQQGFFSGIAPDKFGPDQPLTRAQAAVVLTNATNRIAELKGESLFSGMLQTGSQGADVTLLQIYLQGLHLTTNKATGVYDSETEALVRSFQQANGLATDGIAGPNTLNAIKEKMGK
jgi:spore germination protein YaaH